MHFTVAASLSLANVRPQPSFAHGQRCIMAKQASSAQALLASAFFFPLKRCKPTTNRRTTGRKRCSSARASGLCILVCIGASSDARSSTPHHTSPRSLPAARRGPGKRTPVHDSLDGLPHRGHGATCALQLLQLSCSLLYIARLLRLPGLFFLPLSRVAGNVPSCQLLTAAHRSSGLHLPPLPPYLCLHCTRSSDNTRDGAIVRATFHQRVTRFHHGTISPDSAALHRHRRAVACSAEQ